MWLLLAILLGVRSAAAAEGAPVNVLVVVVDALRADAVGAYGYTRRPTTPNLDRFARRGVVFENCLSQAAWSVPAMASLFSGVDPQAHQVLRYNPQTRVGSDTLHPGETTFAEVFAAAGYQTVALKKSVVVDPARGMAQGFAISRVVGGDMAEGRSAAELTDAAVAWLDGERDPARPFLLYLHYMDPHSSYRAPEPFYSRWTAGYRGSLTGDHMEIERRFVTGGERLGRADRAQLRALYDAEVAWWDQEFGRLMQHLVATGVDARTVVVVVADHGEALGEHGRFFHGDVWQENLRVPFVLKAPGVAPGRLSHWTQLTDLAPTLVDLAGLPHGPRWTGRSQLAALRGGAPPVGPVYAEHADLQALVTPEGEKLVVGGGGVRMYDLRADPHERNDLALARGIRVDRLRVQLDARVRAARALQAALGQADVQGAPAVPARPLTPEEVEALEAAGFGR